MGVETELDWWWSALIMVGAVAACCWKLIVGLIRGGSTERPMPALDRTARTATVVGTQLAPRRRARGGARALRLPGDLWLVRVEYRDADGAVRSECLADVIHDDDVHRFAIGTTWQVHGFVAPRATAGAGRCLLAEAHDDVPRSGYDLDGVRVRGAERQVWHSRRGSPFFGQMAFSNDATWHSEPVVGRRTSWPGDPAEVWLSSGGTSDALRRPRRAPAVASAEEVSRWQDPSGLSRTETYFAPIFWVLLPVAAIGYLIFGAITDPAGDTWRGEVFGEPVTGGPWSLGIVWVGVSIWLLAAIGVLAFRVRLYPRWRRESAEWAVEHGIVCEVHGSTFVHPGADGPDVPGRILIDHRLPDARAARIVRAFRAWVSSGDVVQELIYGSLNGYGCIASAEIFGAGAAGGWFRVTDLEAGGWVLVTETPADALEGDEPPWRRAEVTAIPSA